MKRNKIDKDKTKSITEFSKGHEISHYKILSKIGSGGMSEVYLAKDIILNRQVALKFLLFHLTEDIDIVKKFTNEARAIAKLNHPNIIIIHEVGNYLNRPFLATEYIKGSSLEDILIDQKLSIDHILEFVLQVCEGLKAAHQNNIIHRDIKPSNLLLNSNGQVKIIDFGLALIDSNVTNKIEGTVKYMSPEQIQKESIDFRSDFFSLGIVLYEMLTGFIPFHSNSYKKNIMALLNDEPESPKKYRPDISDSLEKLIFKLLNKKKEFRYQSIEDLIVDLKTELININKNSSPLFGNRSILIPSIAVLPFHNFSNQPDQDYFCDGIAEEVINALTQIKQMKVASRSSSFVFKNQNFDIREIGRKLNVDAVLEGSVQKIDNRLRITAQLINVADGYHLWSNRYDMEYKDIFSIQDEISENIVSALKVIITTDEQKNLSRIPTNNIQAYDFYLKGRQYFHHRRKKSLLYAAEMYKNAMQLDNEFSLALAGLANCYSILIHFYNRNSGTTNEELDKISQRAVDLDPGSAETHSARGLALWILGNDKEADSQFKIAQAIDPNHFESRYYNGRACFQRGDFINAISYFDQASKLKDDYEAFFFLAQSYTSLKYNNEAEKAYFHAAESVKKHILMNPDDARAFTIGAVSLLRCGEKDEGLELGKKAAEIDPYDNAVKYNIACLFAQAGDHEIAFKYLEEIIKANFGSYEWLSKDPDLDPLRNDPRFNKLLENYL